MALNTPGRADDRRLVEPALAVIMAMLVGVGVAGVAALHAGHVQSERSASSSALALSFDDLESVLFEAELARHEALTGDPRGTELQSHLDTADAALAQLRDEHPEHRAGLAAIAQPLTQYRAAATGGSDRDADLAADALLQAVAEESRAHEAEAVKARTGVVALLQRMQAGLVVLLLVTAGGAGLAARRLVTRRRGLQTYAAEREHASQHDQLTGLPNRTVITREIQRSLADGLTSGKRVAVLWIDLDGFKTINDSLGHPVGDDLLRIMASRLRDAVRPGDTVARFGGDEFVVLCRNLPSEATVLQVAERLGRAVREPVSLHGGTYVVTASIGVAQSPMPDADALLSAADAAMYRAKAGGRGQYAVFDESLHSADLVRLQLGNDLALATSRGELRLHYQPLLALTTERVIGVEALMRWEHPERGLLQPAAFMAHAEDSGLIVEMGAWVLEQACRTVAGWQQQGDDSTRSLRMSINLSARQLVQPDLVALVDSAIRRTGIPPHLLCLEVTESAVMTDIARAIATLEDLRRLGVHIAIDDFGSGYSSLSYLKQFPAHQLKLDRAFVQGICEDPRDCSIVTAVVGLCQAVGLTLVAEGIETERQRDLLLALGCDVGQGYLWSRPLPQADLERWLTSRSRAGAALPG